MVDRGTIQNSVDEKQTEDTARRQSGVVNDFCRLVTESGAIIAASALYQGARSPAAQRMESTLVPNKQSHSQSNNFVDPFAFRLEGETKMFPKRGRGRQRGSGRGRKNWGAKRKKSGKKPQLDLRTLMGREGSAEKTDLREPVGQKAEQQSSANMILTQSKDISLSTSVNETLANQTESKGNTDGSTAENTCQNDADAQNVKQNMGVESTQGGEANTMKENSDVVVTKVRRKRTNTKLVEQKPVLKPTRRSARKSGAIRAKTPVKIPKTDALCQVGTGVDATLAPAQETQCNDEVPCVQSMVDSNEINSTSDLKVKSKRGRKRKQIPELQTARERNTHVSDADILPKDSVVATGRPTETTK